MKPATDEEIDIVKDMDHPLVQSLIARIQVEVEAREKSEELVVFWRGKSDELAMTIERCITKAHSLIQELEP